MQWKSISEKLVSSNSNTIPDFLQGIMFQPQFYSRAFDLSEKIGDKVLSSSGDAKDIIQAVHRRVDNSIVTW